MDNPHGFDTLEGNDIDNMAMAAGVLEQAEDNAIDAPPAIGTDERRMQVRAYNFWAGQLGERNFPHVEELEPEALEDFGPYSVLLDFTSGVENPSISYLGDKLRIECALDEDITYLDEVPPRSLLSRITDHYLQIIANRAPIGFEAEFVNEQGLNIMYRGILLPYSSDDDSIDFIYGVINWKEAADAELAQDIKRQLDAAYQPLPRHEIVPTWADGPASQALDTVDVNYGLINPAHELNLGSDFAIDVTEDEPDDSSSLADWLQSARTFADEAASAELRSHDALYRAIGRAWDFALASRSHAQDYKQLLADSGIEIQERAPMTPIVKLVFGINYNKTRLTEFASALHFADRNMIVQGDLYNVIRSFKGGLKGLINVERLERKVARGDHVAVAKESPRARLRNAPARELFEFAHGADEFVLLVGRRDGNGNVVVIGAVDADSNFTDKALGKAVI